MGARRSLSGFGRGRCLTPEYSLLEAFNGLRSILKTGAPWRILPRDLPPWAVVYLQMHGSMEAEVFETLTHGLRDLMRRLSGRDVPPTAAVAVNADSRTFQPTPESGGRAGFDGAKKRKGTKMHAAVDTLGNVLDPIATAADAQDRDQVAALATKVQEVTGRHVAVAWVDDGSTGSEPKAAAEAHTAAT